MIPRLFPPLRSSGPPRPRQGGFSLVEMLLVMVLLGLLVTFGLYRFGTTMKMLRLEGASRDISDVLNRARAEAIKLHVPTVVEYDFPNGRFWAFTDHDHDLSYKCPGMIACPGPYRTDEYIFVEYDFPSKAGVPSETLLWGDPTTPPPDPLPAFPAQGAVPTDTIKGFTATGGKQVAVFLPSGILRDTGSYFITDIYGENHLEVALETRSGLTEIRKYLHEEDAPGAVAGFYGRSLHATEERELAWVWY